MSEKPDMDRQSLSVANLCDRWACSRSLINDMIRDGRLVAMRLGPKTLRIPMAEIERSLVVTSLRQGLASPRDQLQCRVRDNARVASCKSQGRFEAPSPYPASHQPSDGSARRSEMKYRAPSVSPAAWLSGASLRRRALALLSSSSHPPICVCKGSTVARRDTSS